jgi:hypothetical protein
MIKNIKVILSLILIFFSINASANTVVVSNLSIKKTDTLINKITKMYKIGFDVNQNPESVKQFLTKNYILYSNSQKQNLTQLITHLNYLHKTYQKITRSPFEIIQITNDYMTLKYKVYLTNNKKTKGFNFIAIYHFNHNKIDKTWEVASPISANNIH